MDYEGHPVSEPPLFDPEAFHDKRGHGAVRIKFPTARSRYSATEIAGNEQHSPGMDDHAKVSDGLPNGVWTIEGPRGHRTFRISTVLTPSAPQAPGYSPASQGEKTFRERHQGKRVLELLTGPDNTSSYKGLAWYSRKIGNLWKFGTNNEVLVNTFAKLVERAEVLPGYTVHFAKHCLKCNRLLTTPESIERGIGPVCANGGWD